ncbi:MAG: adenylyl-sulfate kinase [Planctomycetota bacterium]|nr:adenylyl-sulfate kinase [Planctomycetota bacterium]
MSGNGQRRVRVAIVGHVDHGKSTMVGRLLHETDSLPEGRLASVERVCRQQGKDFEYAFLLDALEEERDQGVTIDTAQVWLKLPGRETILFDAPGHKEFVKNMVVGAASADAALIMIDAAEGVQEQTRRHGHLLKFLGIQQVVVIVNKMDLCDWSFERFQEIEREYAEFLGRLGVEAKAYIPISAREGDNVTRKSTNMLWYRGLTVAAAIGRLEIPAGGASRPLRMCVQDIYKFDERRILAGRVESGRIAVGDTVLFSPSNKTAVVSGIERWSVEQERPYAEAGESIGFTLEEQIFVERGEIVSHEERAPLETDVFKAKIFWMGKEPLQKGRTYTLKLLTQEVSCEVDQFERVLDAATMQTLGEGIEEVPRNEIGEVVLRTERPIALDSYAESPSSGRFVLVDGYDVCGGGTVAKLQYPDQRPALNPVVQSKNITWEAGLIRAEDRRQKHGHKGAVVWFTGLSGAGKSTVSQRVEKVLFDAGVLTYRLDGDNVRQGLNADLGFAPDDRAENIRRIAEVANLFADAGHVVLTSFISPYRSDRRRAREIARTGRFFEVFVDCPVEVCEERDPKGLYRKARAGEIKNFTGISAPYEKPEAPEIYVNTESISPDEAVAVVVERLCDFGILPESVRLGRDEAPAG